MLGRLLLTTLIVFFSIHNNYSAPSIPKSKAVRPEIIWQHKTPRYINKENERFSLLGTNPNTEDFALYFFDREKNSIRVLTKKKFKTYKPLLNRNLRAFGVDNKGNVMLYTEQPGRNQIEHIRPNGVRFSHLRVDLELEYDDTHEVVWKFPNYFLFEEEYTLRIHRWGKTKKFKSIPLVGDKGELLLSLDFMEGVLDITYILNKKKSDIKYSLNTSIDSVVKVTPVGNGVVQIVLEGEIQYEDEESEDDPGTSTFYVFKLDTKKKKISLDYHFTLPHQSSDRRDFWTKNKKLFMTEWKNKAVSIFRIK
jgi:hypothetical protein